MIKRGRHRSKLDHRVVLDYRHRSAGACLSGVLSPRPGKIVSMDGVTIIALTCGLLVGIPLGALAGWAIVRARQHANSADLQLLIAQSHGEAANARAEAAQARPENAQARSDVAEARSDAAAARAAAAEVSAELASAIAQRGAPFDREKEITADRESM